MNIKTLLRIVHEPKELAAHFTWI